MQLERLTYSLPSAMAFIDSVANSARDGVAVVLLPDNLSREMVCRLIRDRLDKLNISYRDLSNPRAADPVTVSAGAMEVSWQSDRIVRNVRNLLSAGGLADVLFVHRIGPNRPAWTKFIEDWAWERNNLRGSGRNGIPSLCVISKLRDFDFTLPEAETGLAFHWWWGFPSALEMRLACRIAGEPRGDSREERKWREFVLPSLVGCDVQLAEQMWDLISGTWDRIVNGLTDYVESLEQSDDFRLTEELIEAVTTGQRTYAIGQELPRYLHQAWASGALIYTPEYGLEIHPSLLALASRKKELETMLWRGQAEFLLPILNEIRLRVCNELTEAYGVDWPIIWEEPATGHELEQVKITPLATELGYIHFLFRTAGEGHPLRSKCHLSGLVLLARNIRNQIAHNNPVPFQNFVDLCKEQERVVL